jgi:hypothetical protein
MFGSRIVLPLTCLLAVAVGIDLAPAFSQVPESRPDFRSLLPTLDAIDEAAGRVATTHCNTHECQAVATIARALDIMLDGQATTMGLTEPIPPDRDRIAERRLRATVLRHPEQFGAICDVATGLAARYPGMRGTGDLFVAVGIIELASRMDMSGGKCLPTLLAAFPRVSQADTAISNARTLCISGRNSREECERIARP